jgi:hypothetical protein
MLAGTMRRLSALMALACLAGCATVDYVGTSYPPTTQVDIYMSESDVRRPYQVIGEARAQVDAIPFTNPGPQLQQKIVTEARARGAHGAILSGLSSREVASTTQTVGQGTSKKKGNKRKGNWVETSQTSSEEVTELRARLIRYTDR